MQLPRGGAVMPGVARSVPSPPAVAPPAGGNPPAGAPIAMPAGAGLAAGKAPPFRLPGEHFTAALCFLALGTAGIVVAAPELASGAYLSPRVTAITHLFTLGWITTSIMGALYQFLPVATGQPIRSARMAHATFTLYVPGVLAFVTGLVTGRMPVMLGGAAAMGTAVLAFVANLGATLHESRRRDATWWALACAACFLAVTVLLGLALAGNLNWGYLGGGRLLALGTHLHVALAGWVLMVMIGVAHRLLPMFLLSHGAGERFAKAAVALVACGAGVLAVLHHSPPLISSWLPALLITAGCIAFLMQAREFYVHRHRRELDPGMGLAAVALAMIAVGVVLAWIVLLADVRPRIAVAYVATLLMGISLFVVAHYYKIIPFLVWYHRWGPLAGKRQLPRVNELYSATLARSAGMLLILGALGILPSIVLGAPAALRVGALVFAAGVMLVIIQMIQLARNSP